ncbi:PIN domain-containing protein [Psychrobium sp. MM17-31]|uniref:PIN domain-containing protein n=1 Tax=Psychrobium sp. MM17-31 TaxID=2917758 RepID=UPI001EF449EE|nr:PIN domain-containing protein [Psychrobium sp. MM17-31]MCG7530410.1 PIN domain-containing protein [Psychrobium sp. MM17-31]
MINLILDTNILHQEGLNSGRMQVLKKLIENDMVRLFIPEIVKREFTTKRASEITKALNNMKGDINKLQGRIDFDNDLKSSSQEIEKELNRLKEIVEERVEAEFQTWVNELKVTISIFNPEHIYSVLNDYFSGNGVFRSLKQREDLPDSMIHQTIKQIVSDVGEVHLTLIDGAFKKHMKKAPNVKVYDSLNEFFTIDTIENFLANAQFEQYFSSNKLTTLLMNYLRTQDELISQIYIPDGAVENIDQVGIRIFNAEINYPDAASIDNLSISNFYLISETEFTAAVSFTSRAPLHFISDYGNYLELERDKDRNVDMDSMNGEGICDLYEFYIAEFQGTISFHFDEKYELEQIESLFDNLTSVDSSTLSISVDIERARLLNETS